ncbi:MAG: hypothetical protein CTY36_06015 [Methylocystis sp.]|nr:MAG: hypothetical protein CTY36_06015 [Methylocystis sp.]
MEEASVMLLQPSEAANASETAQICAVSQDAAKAWERFSAAWPFDPVPYRRAAARAEFEKLTEAEREEAIRCAGVLAKARRATGRMAAPDARRWLKEKRWKSSGERAPQSSRSSGARLNVRTG